MIARYPVFRERLAAEWPDIRRAAQRAIHALEQAGRQDDDLSIYLDSAALNLHGFYNGLERTFEWLARQLDRSVPEGASWHGDLLAQMSLSIDGLRPAVIRPETRSALEDFLAFRHLVRNTYTWDFEAGRVSDLVARLPELLAMLELDFEQFAAFLGSAGYADETP